MSGRRKTRKLTSSASVEAHALEDFAYLERAKARLLARMQASGALTDVEVPVLPEGTDWLADRAAARRGNPTAAEVDDRKRDLMDRVARVHGYANAADWRAAGGR